MQTITYSPHFISIVMLVGMLMQLFNPNVGMYGVIYKSLTGTKPADPFAIPEAFFYMYIGSGIWKSFGWGSIFYLAALTNVPPELYEAAEIDGASRLQLYTLAKMPASLPPRSCPASRSRRRTPSALRRTRARCGWTARRSPA